MTFAPRGLAIQAPETGGVDQPMNIDDVDELNWGFCINAALTGSEGADAEIARRGPHQSVIDGVV
jgi:hypothetical protein